MHWTLPDVLALPLDVYDVLIEVAPKWLGTDSES